MGRKKYPYCDEDSENSHKNNGTNDYNNDKMPNDTKQIILKLCAAFTHVFVLHRRRHHCCCCCWLCVDGIAVTTAATVSGAMQKESSIQWFIHPLVYLLLRLTRTVTKANDLTEFLLVAFCHFSFSVDVYWKLSSKMEYGWAFGRYCKESNKTKGYWESANRQLCGMYSKTMILSERSRRKKIFFFWNKCKQNIEKWNPTIPDA